MLKTISILPAFLFLAIFLTGCLGPTLPRKPKPAEVYFTPQENQSSDFATEIEKLIGISADTKASNIEKAEAHRRLAILYLNPKNPARDFRRAVDELGKFLELAPERLDAPTAASWATALKSGEELQAMQEEILNLKKQMARLNRNNRQLAKDKKDLKTANTEFAEIIEKLKQLDLSMEKKRRDLR